MPDEYIPRKAVLKIIYTSTAPALEVKAMPAADVIEIRHGYWIKQPPDFDLCGVAYYQCSECGKE